MSILVAPSILSANFLELQKDILMLNKSNADWIHVDVMDGIFVPNISFGFPIIKSLSEIAEKPLDVHLMIEKPDTYIERFVQNGASMISIHYEASPHLHRSIQLIKNLGCKAGVVLNPHTSVSVLEEILPELDYVLLMSVNPGFGGQKFIPQTIKKIQKLKKMILQMNLTTLIEVDGGINLNNVAEVVNAGADVVVAGSAVFNSENPEKIIDGLKM